MINATGTAPFASRPSAYPYWAASAGAWSGVRTRRMLAVGIDLLVVGTLCGIVIPLLLSFVALPLGPLVWVGSLALSWIAIPTFFPVVAFFYNGLTIAGPGMGTLGMRLMDLEVRHVDGGRAPFLAAAVQAVLFYLSWMFPPVFLVSLVTSDKICLHDILAQVRVMRRAI